MRSAALVATAVAVTSLMATATPALADSPQPSPTSPTTPPAIMSPLPADPPAQWPVQPITGSPQRLVFITASTDGASMDIDGTEFVLAADVLFAYNKARLTRRAQVLLNRVVAKLEASPPHRLQVAGHTDSDGTAAHNRRLSLNRAAAVRRYLRSHLSTTVPITTVGFGETRPRFDNKTRSGRAANRRVEITVRP